LRVSIESRSTKNMSSTRTIPPGWRWVQFRDICDQDREIIEPGSDLAKTRPYLSLEHIESNSGRILREPNEASEDEGQSTTFAFDSRHVLYGKLRPYLNKVALPDFEGRCTTELIPLLPKHNISRRFLAWLLRRPATVEAAMREKTGSRMPRANMDHVLSVKIVIPNSLDLQEQIVNAFEANIASVLAARKATQEQIHFLDLYTRSLLRLFPNKFASATLTEGTTDNDR